MIEAGAERGFLAEIAREGEGSDTPVALVGGDNGGERRIGASVVDEQDFPSFAGRDLFENRSDALDEWQDALLLVLHRHDDREQRRDNAALDQLRVQVPDRRRCHQHGLLARTSGHMNLPVRERRLGWNGLRDLYFLARHRGEEPGGSEWNAPSSTAWPSSTSTTGGSVARRRILEELIVRVVRPPKGARVLEVGCGTGHNLAMLGKFGDSGRQRARFRRPDALHQAARPRGEGGQAPGPLDVQAQRI